MPHYWYLILEITLLKKPKKEIFLDIVKTNWTADFMVNLFTLFHHKMKKVKAALTQCSKTTFANILQEIEALEDVIKVHEAQYETQPSPNNWKDFI